MQFRVGPRKQMNRKKNISELDSIFWRWACGLPRGLVVSPIISLPTQLFCPKNGPLSRNFLGCSECSPPLSIGPLHASMSECDNTSSRPPLHQLLPNDYVMAGDSSSGSDRGITHLFMATRNTTDGMGEKEQTNNKGFGQLKMQGGRFRDTAFPVHL